MPCGAMNWPGSSPIDWAPRWASILIAVGDVNISLRRQRRVRATIEWISAECGSGGLGRSDRHQELAVRRALAHGVAEVIGEVEQIAGPDAGPKGIGNADVLSPRAKKFPVPIEHDDRVSAPGEHVHIVLAVDAHSGGITLGDARRQLAPAFNDPIAESTLPEDYRPGGACVARRQDRTCASQSSSADYRRSARGRVLQESPACNRAQLTHGLASPSREDCQRGLPRHGGRGARHSRRGGYRVHPIVVAFRHVVPRWTTVVQVPLAARRPPSAAPPANSETRGHADLSAPGPSASTASLVSRGQRSGR